MTRIVVLAFTFAAGAMAAGATAGNESVPPRAQATLDPTDALHRAWVAVATMPEGTAQPVVVGPILMRTRSTDLNERETLALAAVHFLNFQPDQADAIFSEYLDRRDDVGRWAWIYHEQMLFRAFDQHEEAERDLVEFRRLFPPTTNDFTYTSSMVANLAGRYRQMGDHERAAALVLDDVAGLDVGLPYRSFRALGTFFDSIRAAGRADEARALLRAHRDRMYALANAGGSPAAPAAELFEAPPTHHTGRLHLSWDLRIADDDPINANAVWTARLAAGIVPAYDQALERMGG